MSETHSSHEQQGEPFYIAGDTNLEKFVYDVFVRSGRVSNAVYKFSEGTGDGGYEVIDQQKFQRSINELVATAKREMQTERPLEKKEEITKAVEKVLMRELVLLSPEPKDLREFAPVLKVQDYVREAMLNSVTGGKSFEAAFKKHKN